MSSIDPPEILIISVEVWPGETKVDKMLFNSETPPSLTKQCAMARPGNTKKSKELLVTKLNIVQCSG